MCLDLIVRCVCPHGPFEHVATCTHSKSVTVRAIVLLSAAVNRQLAAELGCRGTKDRSLAVILQEAGVLLRRQLIPKVAEELGKSQYDLGVRVRTGKTVLSKQRAWKQCESLNDLTLEVSSALESPFREQFLSYAVGGPSEDEGSEASSTRRSRSRSSCRSNSGAGAGADGRSSRFATTPSVTRSAASSSSGL